MSSGHFAHDDDSSDEDWPYREMIAIAGGVLGFWGGVWCLGIIFLLSLMMQRSSCRKKDERKKVFYEKKIKVLREYFRDYDPASDCGVVSGRHFLVEIIRSRLGSSLHFIIIIKLNRIEPLKYLIS